MSSSQSIQLFDSEPVIAIQAEECWIGTYALRLRLDRSLRIPIGRIQSGRPVDFPAGEYFYAGSALGAHSGLALPRRLLRHATRSAGRPAHPLCALLLEHFTAAGLDANRLLPRTPKRLHWNIDHLTGHPEISLVQVFYIRSPLRLEHALVAYLEQDPDTSIIVRGFGAHDHRGHTHLFAVPADAAWRSAWHDALRRLAGAAAPR
jgi:Uri superfamily endonuclease